MAVRPNDGETRRGDAAQAATVYIYIYYYTPLPFNLANNNNNKQQQQQHVSLPFWPLLGPNASDLLPM